MCELFAMASRVPATVNLSLDEFARHGGLTDHHKDGWGIAYYQDRDAQIIREPHPAFDSAQLQFVRHQGLGSSLVISHIRKATQGEPALRNTQPFSRELFGRVHVFVHNGMLPAITDSLSLESDHYLPIGETDSEYAFCVLLNKMHRLWSNNCSAPDLAERLKVVGELADELRPLGPANFIYSDGDYIFGHGDKRTHRDGIRPPGLFLLHRSCEVEPQPVDVPGLLISTQAESQDIVLLASVPLTDETWTPLKQGEILVLQKGFVVDSSQPRQ
jgi:predicted glutamine amidotransferase